MTDDDPVFKALADRSVVRTVEQEMAAEIEESLKKQVFETYFKASAEVIWDAITTPEQKAEAFTWPAG